MLLSSPFRFYILKNWRPFTIGLTSLLLTNTLDCLLPLLLKEVIDTLTAKSNYEQIFRPLSIYLGLILLVALFRFAWRLFFSRYHQNVAEDLRNRIFDKYTLLGLSFFNRHPVGQLMSLITNDVNSFRMGIGPGVLLAFDAIFYCAVIIPAMIYLSPSWTLQTLLPLTFLPFFVAKAQRLIQERFNEKQKKFSELSGIAQEMVSGVRLIKGFALEREHTENFNQVSRQLEHSSNQTATAEAVLEPVMQMAVCLGVVILFFIGPDDIRSGQATIGSFVAFLRYLQKLGWPMTEFGFAVNMFLEARASFNRIRRVLIEPMDVPDTGSRELVDFEKLEVRNLNFSFNSQEKPILKNISLVIRRGERVGFFGPIGSGKTTLIHLLCRLYESAPNTIFINDLPIQNIQLASLHRLFCLVPQNISLFGDTINYNLTLGLSSYPPLEEIVAYSKVVDLHDEIMATEKGYDTILGERGVNLSGGQKQRLTIARGLIRKAPVLILDDVLSAVDADTEKQILQNLQGSSILQNSARPTILVTSHRIACLMNCDRIYVFNDGEIVAQGTHDDLILKSEFYRSVFQMQAQSYQPPKAEEFSS